MVQKFKNKINADANLKELLSGSAVTFIIKVTGMFLGYLVVLMISRKYGAEGTGVYSLTLQLLNSLAILGCLGMDISVLRYIGQFSKHEDASARLKQLYTYLLKLSFPFAILVGITLYIFAEELALNLFENTTYTPALKISAFALPFFTINLINVEFIRGLKRLKISEYLRSINRQLIILILLTLSVLEFGILNSVYALIAGLLCTFVLSFTYILNYFKNNKAGKIIGTGLKIKELVLTSSPMMATAVASFVLANAGAVFLEIYSTTDQVGVFSVCLRLAQLVSLVLVVVNTISAPKFAELYWAGKIDELKKVIYQSSKLIFWMSIAVSIILISFSEFFLGFFGEEFKSGTWVMVILILGQIINAIAGSVGIFFNMTGNQKPLRNFFLITSGLVLTSYILFVPTYGMMGVAVITTAGTIVLNLACVIFIYRKLNIVTFYIPFMRLKK